MDSRIVHQLRRVLRGKKGDVLTIQSDQSDRVIRYGCRVETLSDTSIEAHIESESYHPYRNDHKHLIIGMSNKRDKMELIIQKAVECGISQITIVPMSRSIIRQHNTNKRKRLESIILEATEQSWSTQLPTLQWCNSIKEIVYRGQVLICNMGGIPCFQVDVEDDVDLIIGPEGGLDTSDLKQLATNELSLTTISLGSTVLRMETAAIVGARRINQ